MAIRGQLAWLAWHLRRGWDAVGPLDLAGLSTLGLWVGLSLVVNLPLRREVDGLRRLTPSVPTAARPSLHATAPALAGASPAGRVDAFMRFLPPLGLRDQQLRSFHALAQKSAVRIVAIEYVPGDLEHLPGQRFTLRVSAAAEVSSYRKFVHELLAGFPNLAIDRLATQADAAQPGRLEVRLESSYYYRRDNATGRRTP
jgi:hypothetical protein